MLRLFVTRHGETVLNTQRKLQGWKDSDLTENGMENALSLGNRLKDVEFHSIYASPSNRTLMTASLIKGDDIRVRPWYGEVLMSWGSDPVFPRHMFHLVCGISLGK
nr:histidine phosphatase family protein [Rossellomorea arthrocnemi]